jgi:hypothetical protein
MRSRVAVEAGRYSGYVAVLPEQVVILNAARAHETWVGISAIEAKGQVD